MNFKAFKVNVANSHLILLLFHVLVSKAKRMDVVMREEKNMVEEEEMHFRKGIQIPLRYRKCARSLSVP